jgi:5-methylcytosine-specific restriction endonuclease McrA
MSDARVCTSCGQSTPIVRFTGNLRKCNRCRNAGMSPEAKREASRRYRAKDPETQNERTRQYRRNNPHMSFYSTSRYQAKLAGVPTSLTVEDALDVYSTPNICAYCGVDHGSTPGKRIIHVDHIIPMVQGGHNTRWNLTKVCISCNTSKDSASLIDFRERTPEFTEERYAAVIARMVDLSGHSTEHITHLLEQSHAFELAYQAQRAIMATLLAA